MCVQYEIFISPQVILDHHVTFANFPNQQQNNCNNMYETLIHNINAVRLSTVDAKGYNTMSKNCSNEELK